MKQTHQRDFGMTRTHTPLDLKYDSFSDDGPENPDVRRIRVRTSLRRLANHTCNRAQQRGTGTTKDMPEWHRRMPHWAGTTRQSTATWEFETHTQAPPTCRHRYDQQRAGPQPTVMCETRNQTIMQSFLSSEKVINISPSLT